MAKKSSESFEQGKLTSVSAACILSKPLTAKQKATLRRLKDMPDAEIDYSDIPAFTEEEIIASRRARTVVAARLDPNVVAWLQSFGPGYTTRINSILRTVMKSPAQSGDTCNNCLCQKRDSFDVRRFLGHTLSSSPEPRVQVPLVNTRFLHTERTAGLFNEVVRIESEWNSITQSESGPAALKCTAEQHPRHRGRDKYWATQDASGGSRGSVTQPR